jgi:hypothetical protein
MTLRQQILLLRRQSPLLLPHPSLHNLHILNLRLPHPLIPDPLILNPVILNPPILSLVILNPLIPNPIPTAKSIHRTSSKLLNLRLRCPNINSLPPRARGVTGQRAISGYPAFG